MIKLFVVGYPLDIEDSELIEIFSIHGMIHSIHLLTDKVTHKHKGYGFIEMVDQAGADRAIAALNGMVLKGRKITVKLADEARAEKPRTFKPNRFPSSDDQANNDGDTQTKSKRPRKLVSNTYRAEN
ncbi:RNA recognition motif domain-containing protein [Pedobacter metabolipauper]|uniref:RNA recognition motif-containing protein n=1 Tax=Pedobacter metabolipauper TaxID=425513 RepID=A0A4R6SS84_9SPHI|nr:RNA-binding protein [Pedobacter metabolipauper]TDQ08235.1 RNA recognition motif-containing protein [Pedobacter metabolipauper]